MVLECKHVWDYISGYLDDSLSPAIKAEVQRHLEHCEICSAILDSTRNILVLTADDRVFELPVGFSERLHARLGPELKLGKRMRLDASGKYAAEVLDVGGPLRGDEN